MRRAATPPFGLAVADVRDSQGRRDDSGLRQLRQVAWHPCATAIAHDALPAGRVSVHAARAATTAPVGLATVDDHGHVLVALVVLHQLRVELVGKRLGTTL